MDTIMIEALAPLIRTCPIKMHRNVTRSRLVCRIVKKSITVHQKHHMQAFPLPRLRV